MSIGCLKRFLINQNVATAILIFQTSLKSVLSLKLFQGKTIFIYMVKIYHLSFIISFSGL